MRDCWRDPLYGLVRRLHKTISRLIVHCRALADEKVQLLNRITELEEQPVDKQDTIEGLKDQVDTYERNAG